MIKIPSLKLTAFMCLGLLVNAVHADQNDDFLNNLLTDLAPLITLFGEKVVTQFMSQSMGLADCVALAMAPIGVLTIIVSAIRVGDPTWLKAIIGRARENLSTAELELMSSTSKEACELWNGRNVVRCPGSGQIMQFVCLVPKNATRNEDQGSPWQIDCLTLKEAQGGLVTTVKEPESLLQSIEISVSSKLFKWAKSKLCKTDAKDLERGETFKASPTATQSSSDRPNNTSSNAREQPQRGSSTNNKQKQYIADPKTSRIIVIQDSDKSSPNVSLNCHNQRSRLEIILVATIGVLIQTGVLVYCGFATRERALKAHLLKDNNPVRYYAFPLTLTGTMILSIGVLICGIVVERSTKECYYEANGAYDTYVVWLQKEGTISDQDFKPFAIYPNTKCSFITTSRRNVLHDEDQGSHQKGGEDPLGLETVTVFGCFISVIGFLLQFTGLRAMNFTVPLVQFCAMAVMTALRAWVRRGLVNVPSTEPLVKGFELDWLANTLGRENPDWVVDNGNPRDAPLRSFSWTGTAATRAQTEVQKEYMYCISRRGKPQAQAILDIRRQLGKSTRWRGPVANQAIMLADAIESVAREVGPKLRYAREDFEFDVGLHQNLWKLTFTLELQNGMWKIRTDAIEAALSLWVSATQEQDNTVVCETSEDEWLRLQILQQRGLRVLGTVATSSQGRTLARDLGLWLPEGNPDMIEVEEIKNGSGEHGFSVPSHRVVGFDIGPDGAASQPLIGGSLCHFFASRVCDTERQYFDSTERLLRGSMPLSFGCHHGAAQAISYDQPSTLKIGKLLAVLSEDSLERLFARQIFFAFVNAIGQHNDWRLQSETKATGDYHLGELKLSDKGLSKIASGVRETGFLNHEEAFFDLIISWSLCNALPGANILVDHLQEQLHRYILETRESDLVPKNGRELEARFDRDCTLSGHLRSFFILAMTFGNSKWETFQKYRALALFQYYTEFLDHRFKISCKENRRRTVVDKSDEDKRIHILKREEFTLPFAPCSIFQEQLSIWSYLFDWEGPTDCSRFTLSEYHTLPFGDRSKTPLHKHIDCWVGLAVFGWGRSHYLSVLGQYFADRGFTDGVFTDGAPTDEDFTDEDFTTSTRIFRPLDHKCDIFGFTPLHYACATGNVEIVARLLHENARIEVAPWNGISPLHLAAAKGKVETVSLILQKLKKPEMARQETLSEPAAKNTFKDLDGRTAAHWAAMHGNVEIFELLNTDSTITDRYGWNSLHLAIMYENEKLAKYLITEAKLDLNMKGTGGRTPLQMAMEKNLARTIQLLIDFGADIVTGDATDICLFDTAVRCCDLGVIECLLNKDPDIISRRVAEAHEKDNPKTPLHLAVIRGDLGIAELLLRSRGGRECLLLKNPLGFTPLHTLAMYPSKKDSFAIAKLLAQLLDGNVNLRTVNGDTPLLLAAYWGQVDLAAAMIDIGAYESFFLRSREGKTPLEMAKEAEKMSHTGIFRKRDRQKDWQGIVSQFEGFEKEARKMMERKAGHPISETSSP